MTSLAIGGRLVLALSRDPFQVQTYPDYATYHQLADEVGDFSLLEVPFQVRSGLEEVGQGGDILQYYQLVHGKRLINGMIARLPSSVFNFYRSHPSLLLLGGGTPTVETSELERDLSDVLDWAGAHYVLVHRSRLSADQASRIEKFLGRHPQLELLGLESDLIIYRLNK